MKIYITEGEAAFNRAAAEQVQIQLRRKSESVIGLALGRTTLGIHRELVRMHRYEGQDFSKAVLFILDESIGIAKVHPATGYSRIRTQLFDHINAKECNMFTPDTQPEDADASCAQYEKKLESFGGVDLQILGIGENGHVGFNDPGTPFESTTHIVKISETAKKNKLSYFNTIAEVPEYGITLGLKSIMMARRILLLAKGEKKSEIIKKALFGPISPQVPASVLQLHRHLTVILDASAAAGILPQLNL